MNPRIVLTRFVSALLVLIGATVLVWRFYPLTQASAGPTSLALKAPPFVSVAKAADAAVASTISDEAGISAYFQTPGPITLSSVHSKFRTIERETTDYIIGSIPLKDYPESYDVHVYVHKDGWILAYYLKQDPASKIFDWRAYDTNGATVVATNLENAISTIVNAANVVLTTATYYDFRYPNATHLMLIAETVKGNYVSDAFQVNIPDSFVVFERSWSHAGNNGGPYSLDNVKIHERSGYEWDYAADFIQVPQFLPNQFHTISIGPNCCDGSKSTYGGLALVYKEQ
ncbi:MAG: hypothetical protein U0350_02890 [Caldilineaceae bacterium]